jgi:predicted ArsR family transcriptional regulator
MQKTRKRILSHIQASRQATVREISQTLRLASGTVRHHLSILERDQLVESQANPKGIGRPEQVFSLSERGHERFPEHYDHFTQTLVEQIKIQTGAELLRRVFQRVAHNLLTEQQSSSKTVRSFRERLALLNEVLEREGFVADMRQTGETLQIHQHSCPYQAIARDHAEVCSLDAELIETVMDRPVTLRGCMFSGHSHCTFEVPLLPSEASAVE